MPSALMVSHKLQFVLLVGTRDRSFFLFSLFLSLFHVLACSPSSRFSWGSKHIYRTVCARRWTKMKNYASFENCSECAPCFLSVSVRPLIFPILACVHHIWSSKVLFCPLKTLEPCLCVHMTVDTNWSWIPVFQMNYGHFQIHMAFIAVRLTSFDRYRTFFFSLLHAYFKIIRLFRSYRFPFAKSFSLVKWNDSSPVLMFTSSWWPWDFSIPIIFTSLSHHFSMCNRKSMISKQTRCTMRNAHSFGNAHKWPIYTLCWINSQ